MVQLLQADGGGHVVVRGLVPDGPPHVHWLELDTVLISEERLILSTTYNEVSDISLAVTLQTRKNVVN